MPGSSPVIRYVPFHHVRAERVETAVPGAAVYPCERGILMGSGRSFLMALCMSLVLSACAFPDGPVDNGVKGEGQPLDRDSAITLAKQHSPLREVSEQQVTRLLPVRRVLIGKDDQGRQLAVWVSGNVQRYVYFDQFKLTSREHVLALAAKELAQIRFNI